MVSFVCDQCQQTIKKPKIVQHFSSCYTNTVSCIDCSESFNQYDVQSHNSCVTEAQKYQGKLYAGNKKQKTNDSHHTNPHNNNRVATSTTTTTNNNSNNHQHTQQNPDNNETIKPFELTVQHTIQSIIAGILSKQADSISMKKMYKSIHKQCNIYNLDVAQIDSELMKYLVDNQRNVYIQFKK